jgi:hypothetical protein
LLPQNVKVGGLKYKIVEKSFVEIGHSRNYDGACDYGNTTIEILDSLSDSKKEEVFIHELTHAIFENAGYSDHDEEMVDRLSKVLYQVLKDNHIYFGVSEETVETKFYGEK